MPPYAICALLDELPTSSHFGSTVDMQTKAQPSVSVIRGPRRAAWIQLFPRG